MKKATKQKVENITNFFVSIGAAIVMLGALAKLIHHAWADTMLTVGLTTEALIFIMYAFLPPSKSHEEELLAAILRETRHVEKNTETLGHSAAVDTAPIENLNEILKKIFKV